MARRGSIGCLARLAVILFLSAVAFAAVDAVFAPWAFYLGGKQHLLPFWHAIGRVRGPSGEYVLYFWLTPAPGGRTYNFPFFDGWGYLCTPRGERYSLRAMGDMFEHPGIDTNGKRMRITVYRRPWNYSWVGRYDSRPNLVLDGQWDNPNLILDDGGSLSRAFLPDGSLSPGAQGNRSVRRETVRIVMQEVPWSAWWSDCRYRD